MADDSADDDANSLDCWRFSASKSDACQSDVLQCTPGAIGPLCGSCDAGFFYSSTLLVCQSCKTHTVKNVVVIVVVFLICVLGGMLYTGRLRIPECIQRTWIFGIIRRLDSGTLRVVWSNYQVKF